MKLSNNGLQQIIKREGVILHAYQDTVGVWTIGTGHTTAAGPPKVVPGMVISKADNDTILRRDLAPIEADLNRLIKVHVTQNQYDALVSIVFNVGSSFYTSVCMKRLNAGDYKGAADAIMNWTKPVEITGRRKSEQTQFLTPDSTKSPAGSATAGAVVAGGGALATAPHHFWPWIIGLIILVAAVEIAYHTIKKNQNVVPAN